MSSAELNKRKREEYEMQLFGYHSRAVYTTLKLLMQEKIQSRCQRLADSLEKKYKPEGDNVQLLDSNRRNLAKAYYHGCRIHLPSIENLVDKLIAVPQHVLLDEDKIQAQQYTEDQYKEMKNNFENLQQRLKTATIINARLKEELVLAEQFEQNISTADTLCKVIYNGSKYPEESSMMIKLVENFKELEKNIDEMKRPTKRQRAITEPNSIDIDSL